MATGRSTVKITLGKYLKFKGYKVTIKHLGEISLYSKSGLIKMYKRDPATIDALIELHREELFK